VESCVSVVIVNYNGGPLLTECVRSVLASTVPVEVLVSDNASSDNSLLLLRLALGGDPRLNIVENARNLGFAKGNNRVLPLAKGDRFLFLNPDCLLQPDTIARMSDLLARDSEIGMAGCLIRNPDGTEQPGCRRNIPTPSRVFFQMAGLKRFSKVKTDENRYLLVNQPLPEKPQQVEAISGAFMLIPRNALEDVGLLDEGYFMHFEDLDWCVRFNAAGWKVVFEPRVEILHVGGVCSASKPIGVEYFKHRSMVRFYRKFFQRSQPFLLYFIVMPSIIGRFLVQVFKHGLASVGLYRPRQPARQAEQAAMDSAQTHLRLDSSDGKGRKVVVTGATSLIGNFMLPLLVHAGYEVHAISRHPPDYGSDAGITWHQADLETDTPAILKSADILLHLGILLILPTVLDRLGRDAPKRVIAFGSTSVFTKGDSGIEKERLLVEGLSSAEEWIRQFGASNEVNWTILRPTLVYHLGRDKNVTTIATFLQRFGFFPIVDGAKGKRQPVHAEDLAIAALNVIENPKTFGKAYNLSGGETLAYREMVSRVADYLGMRPKMLNIPLSVLQMVIRVVSCVPRYRYLNIEMARRIGRDNCFDHASAREDFGYSPRLFFKGGV
jgi:GT2 family glycosyltransferase/nucleoside-diphosphate-sugar epimerase